MMGAGPRHRWRAGPVASSPLQKVFFFFCVGVFFLAGHHFVQKLEAWAAARLRIL